MNCWAGNRILPKPGSTGNVVGTLQLQNLQDATLRFPTEGPNVLQGPGEGAGVVDLGDGWAVVFKVESHNHPSAIEPYQGAATGVGGILRDIYSMGARPVAFLNSLRFGPLSDKKDPGSNSKRNQYLFGGVVAGIADTATVSEYQLLREKSASMHVTPGIPGERNVCGSDPA